MTDFLIEMFFYNDGGNKILAQIIYVGTYTKQDTYCMTRN